MRYPVTALLICSLIIAPNIAFAGSDIEHESEQNNALSSTRTDIEERQFAGSQTDLDRHSNEELMESQQKRIEDDRAERIQLRQEEEEEEEGQILQYKWGMALGLTLGWSFYIPVKRKTVCTDEMDNCSADEGSGNGFGLDVVLGYSFGTFYIVGDVGFGLPLFKENPNLHIPEEDAYHRLAALYGEVAIGIYPARFFQTKVDVWQLLLANLHLEVGVGYSSMGKMGSVFSFGKNAGKDGIDPIATQASITAAIGTSLSGLSVSLKFRYFMAPMGVLSIIPTIGLSF